jgi:ketosteroid isomerase-like protein
MLVLGLALAWGTPAIMASAKAGQPASGAVSSPVSSSASAKADADADADAGKPAGLSPQGAIDTTSPTRPTSPAAVVGAFAANFNAGQHDSLMSLYETNAVFVASPGHAVTSTEGIRAATGQFMGLGLPIQIQVRHVFQADDVALVVSDWTIRGKAPSGDAIDMAGTATDVMRRSASGGWRYVIDNPFGGQRPQP